MTSNDCIIPLGGSRGTDCTKAVKANKHRRRCRKGKLADTASNDSGSVRSDDNTVSYVYTRPKPVVLTDAIFMWERVAAFSAPDVVCMLDGLSKDIQSALARSRVGTRLLQRYWNAQWARLLWAPELLSEDKLYLLPSSLSHSDGKKDWRKLYREEYPLWLQRTQYGVGMCNNANNTAKALFHREELNVAMTAQELEKMELTVEEALAKEAAKRGVEVHVAPHTSSSGTGGAGAGDGGDGVARGGQTIKGKGKGITKVARASGKAPGGSYMREDYHQDSRQGDRRGKHKKGGDKKWGGYAEIGDYDY